LVLLHKIFSGLRSQIDGVDAILSRTALRDRVGELLRARGESNDRMTTVLLDAPRRVGALRRESFEIGPGAAQYMKSAHFHVC